MTCLPPGFPQTLAGVVAAAAILAGGDRPAIAAAEAALCWPAPAALDLDTVAIPEPGCPAIPIPDLAAGPAATISLLGTPVHGPEGEDFGLIIDVVVDHQGKPVAAVVDFGGFLGVGSRKVAVAWEAFSFVPEGQPRVRLAVNRAAIQAAPEYKRGVPLAPGLAPGPPADVPLPPPPAAPADSPAGASGGE